MRQKKGTFARNFIADDAGETTPMNILDYKEK
jgi:hypothetical protein